MRVIVCGAGQVGSNIARYLSRFDTDVTMIDIDPARRTISTCAGSSATPDTRTCSRVQARAMLI